MKIKVAFIAYTIPLFLTLVFSGWSQAKVPQLTGPVVDKAELLSQSEQERLTSVLVQFNQLTKGQMAVLIISELASTETIESYSIRVTDSWKLGDKERDDGLLLLISVKERQTRLEVGQGFEGQITDGRAGEILRAMTPYFQAGMFADGILQAINMISETITGHPLATITHAPMSSNRNPPVVINQKKILLLLTLLFALIVITNIFHLGRRRPMIYSGRRRYPKNRGWLGGGGGSYSGGFRGGGGGFSGGGASGRW